MIPSCCPNESNRQDISKPRRTRFKRRWIVFSTKDEAIFSEALRECYPRVEFFRRFPGDDSQHALPQASLPDVSGRYADVILASSENQQSGRRYCQKFAYNRSIWDWACLPGMSYDAPTLNAGEICTSYEPESPDHKELLRIIGQMWKIIERLATNRYKSGHPLGNELSGGDFLLMNDAKAGNAWLGHGALEWCRENPRRMLNGCWRPCDDWHVPQDDWYQTMCRKAVEKCGDDLGTQPASPWR